MVEESYIKIAIELAKKGRGSVSPDPLSGVLFVKKEKIVGAGYAGAQADKTAEQLAIFSAKENLSGSILYSNIESDPGLNQCEKFVEQLKNLNISKVVYGTVNPNPNVMGKTIEHIKKAGIDTKVGVLEEECSEINKFFIKSTSYQRPYITLKIAMTIDGKIADLKGDSKWITSVDSRCLVHELRSHHDAVLVGANTILKDNPELNVRMVEGRSPRRIILDPGLKVPAESKIFTSKPDNIIIITSAKTSEQKKKKLAKFFDPGVSFLRIPLNKNGGLNLKSLTKKLYKQNITSLLVEGGSHTFSSFVKEKLFDEILVFMSPKLLGNGLPAIEGIGIPSIRRSLKLKVKSLQLVGEDILVSLIK